MRISKFVSLLNSKGVARPTQYYVEIRKPAGMIGGGAQRERIAMLCERTQLPGRIINSTKHMIYGVERSMPYGVQYQELPMTFICTDDMEVRNFFDSWHSLVVNMDDNTFNYYDNYTADIFITKVDSRNTPTSVYWIREAYPATITPQEVSYSNKNYLTLDISMAYYSWMTLQDMSINNYNLSLPAIEKIAGDLPSSVTSFPPSTFNLQQLASQFLNIESPISLTFQDAQRIVEDYSSYLDNIISTFNVRF